MSQSPQTAQQPLSLEEARKRFPPMWTIYDHPKDYPRHFVVRRWYGPIPESIGCVCDTLAEARECVDEQGGCVNLGRYDEDDPAVPETWL